MADEKKGALMETELKPEVSKEEPFEPPDKWEKFRRYVRLEIVQSSWFEGVILCVIVVNCIFLALDNPVKASDSLKNAIDILEYIFTAIYLLEMLLKFIAFGFIGVHVEKYSQQVDEQKASVWSFMVNSVFNKGKPQKPDTYVGYFYDGWNILDFITVMVGSVIPLFFRTNNVNAIRSLRILRALRTIPRVPQLKALVLTLTSSLPGLFAATLLLTFFFIVFSIIGLQLFNGVLHKQCIDEDDNLLTYTYGELTYIEFCSDDDDCSKAATTLGESNTYMCKERNNPHSGMESWDNIFYSLLQVFQIVTLEDWTLSMYDLARTKSYIIALYYIPLTFIVSFFATNLILAVLVTTYSNATDNVQEREDKDNTIHEIDNLIQRKTSRHTPVFQEITYDTYPRKVRTLKNKVVEFEKLFREYRRPIIESVQKAYELTKKIKLRVDTERRPENNKSPSKESQEMLELKSIQDELAADTNYNLELEEKKNDSNDYDLDDQVDSSSDKWLFTNRADKQRELRRLMIVEMMKSFNEDLTKEVWYLAKPIKDTYLTGKKKIIHDINRIVTSEWFETGVIIIIILNTIILSIQYPDMSKATSNALDALNYVFTFFFTLELILKLIGLGWDRWWNDKFNVFDAIVVVVSLIELLIPNAEQSGAVLAFRSLRVLRILRLLHQIRSLRILLNSIIESFEPISYLLLIMSLFGFMFAVIGVQLFSDKVNKLNSDTLDEFTKTWRFDTLWYSIVTVIQLFTADGWPDVMSDCVEVTNSSVSILIIVIVIIGVYMFRNLFLAILINRMSNQNDAQLMVDDLLRIAREKQKYIPDESKGLEEFEKEVRKKRKQLLNKNEKKKEKNDPNSTKIIGTSLKIFKPSNKFRIFVYKMVHAEWFEWFINLSIIANCICLALDNPGVEPDSQLGSALFITDWVFTLIFILEMILKVIALGLYESSGNKPQNDEAKADTDEEEQKEASPEANEVIDHSTPCRNAYLKNWWNVFDGIIVIIAILGLIFHNVGFLRGLRAIRPIRVALRIKQIQVVVQALLYSAPNIFNAILFSFFILYVLSIIGIHLFSGEFGRCVLKDSPYTLADYSNKDQCNDAATSGSDVEWINPGFNFDNIFVALLTVWKIANLSNWFDEMSNGMAIQGLYEQINPFSTPFAAFYFIGIAIIGGFFVFNIVISVVVDSFNRIKREDNQTTLLTTKQAIWVRRQRFLSRFPLKESYRVPTQKWRKILFDIVTNEKFEYFIAICILLNTIFLMTEYYNQPKSWKNTLLGIEIFFVSIYAIEAILKLIVFDLRYFRDYWNDFDFIIVIVSLIGFAFSAHGGASIIRLIRVARIIRLIKRAPLLRALFLTLVYAAPSLFNIGLLLLVIFFIWGIFGMELFGTVVYNDGYGNRIYHDANEGITKSNNFETFGNALAILYRFATNDNWGSILLAAGAQGNKCPNDLSGDYNCGEMWISIIYFVSFSIFGTMVMTNLFIAVILDTYIDNVEFEIKIQKLELIRDWIKTWKELDEGRNKKLKGRLHVKDFINSLRKSPKVIGLLLESLNLRLTIEEVDSDLDYNNVDEILRKSSETYGRIDFVGSVNPLDNRVEVTNDHINAIMKTRRFRILCRYIHRGTVKEKLVVYYRDALFAIASLVVGPEYPLLPYDPDVKVHISDWWAELMEDLNPTF